MRRLFYVVAILGLAGAGMVNAYTDRGTISSDETWESASPTDTIRLTGDITVRDNAILTIKPGTIIRGFDNTPQPTRIWITVSGTGVISAIGTHDKIISFNNVCIRFSLLTRDELNIVKYCSFINGWGYAFIEFRNPTEPSETSAPLIDHCTFTKGSYCSIYITSGGSPTITNCIINNSSSGIFLHGGDDVVIRNTAIYNTGTAIINGSISQFKQDLVVDHCVIHEVDMNGPYTWAKGYGIKCLNNAGVLTVTNTIFSQVAGIALKDNNYDDPLFDVMWTVNNDYNCFYTVGVPTEDFNMGTNSIEANPLMTDPNNGDFSLGSGSPCKGAASDGGDIGLWAGAEPVSLPSPVGMDPVSLRLSANPFSGAVVFTLPDPQPFFVTLYAADGTRVRRLKAGENDRQLIWDGRDTHGRTLDNGVYMAVIQTGQGTLYQPVIKAE
jgi:parallel beta-helix repeat protein